MVPPEESKCPQGVANKIHIENIKEDIDKLDDRVGGHIVEGEKQGGYRDRVITLEIKVLQLEKWVLINGIIGGVIGGLIGHGTPEMIGWFIRIMS